ncbi:MAG: HNH endonuclease family protein [Staphylococcus equorum]|nr:HNH endonuclease family protein [Staphylococcus equorum]
MQNRHFHPQNPDKVSHWSKDGLNRFGNLVLLTVSGNSKFLTYYQRVKFILIQVS